jgi:hypothetical protein
MFREEGFEELVRKSTIFISSLYILLLKELTNYKNVCIPDYMGLKWTQQCKLAHYATNLALQRLKQPDLAPVVHISDV